MCGCGNKIRRINTINGLYKSPITTKRLSRPIRILNDRKNKIKIKKLFI